MTLKGILMSTLPTLLPLPPWVSVYTQDLLLHRSYTQDLLSHISCLLQFDVRERRQLFLCLCWI